jgi:hypothetical protein
VDHTVDAKGSVMRWLRESRFMSLILMILAALIYLVMMWRVAPLLWPYREHMFVRLLLALLYGDHLYEALEELPVPL